MDVSQQFLHTYLIYELYYYNEPFLSSISVWRTGDSKCKCKFSSWRLFFLLLDKRANSSQHMELILNYVFLLRVLENSPPNKNDSKHVSERRTLTK